MNSNIASQHGAGGRTIDNDHHYKMSSTYSQPLSQSEEIEGSTEQRKYKEKLLSGGTISPSEFGGTRSFYQNDYLRRLTHGVESGGGHDDKKAVRMKLAGGNMK